MPTFGSEAMGALQRAMQFRMARESVLAGNIANADTPGYRRRDIEFAGVLESSRMRMTRTNGGHLSHVSEDPSKARIQVGPRGTRPDGNGVDLDHELVAAHRNAGAFIDQASVLARVSSLIRTAIGQG